MADQTPPADELFDVRARLKELTAREAALKALMHADPSARTGNAFIVELREVETTRVDLKELRAMHEDLVAEYTFPQKIVRIELRAVDQDTGEITRLPRRAS